MQKLDHFLIKTGPVLILDIGSGTQDAILALPRLNPENWPRFVIPTPAKQAGQRIAELTARNQPVWVYGYNSGSGFFSALKEQIAANLAPKISPTAALAIHDNPNYVQDMGIGLSTTCPPNYTAIYICDYDPGFWRSFLNTAGLPYPSLVIAATQDHGYHPELGNRLGRFKMWQGLLQEGNPYNWVYRQPPAMCTRLQALQLCTGGLVADTGTAAILGSMATPEVISRSKRQGVTIVNIGNSHTIAFLLYQSRIFGVYEHHTSMLDTDSLNYDLQEFRLGWLPDEQVRAAGGHGCGFSSIPPEAEGFKPTFILGPRRNLLAGHGQFIAPYGDMMLAGCHGLLLATSN